MSADDGWLHGLCPVPNSTLSSIVSEPSEITASNVNVRLQEVRYMGTSEHRGSCATKCTLLVHSLQHGHMIRVQQRHLHIPAATTEFFTVIFLVLPSLVLGRSSA